MTRRDQSQTQRRQLTNFNSLDHLLTALSSSSNLIVITGAGISVSCGIPDFRSKGGIYNTIECQEIGLPVAELLFDLKFFETDPEPFYKYASKLIPNQIEPSFSHRFIAELESRNKLLRNYTSNFDGLEKLAGVKNCVQSHGTIQSFKCLKCRRKSSLDDVREEITQGIVPYCSICRDGVLKPDIIFFGELLDPHLLRCLEKDSQICDLVIVIGTSLKVGGPVVSFLNQIPRHVPQILINLNSVSPPKAISEGFDLSLVGECDTIISYLCRCLKWDLSGNPIIDNHSTSQPSGLDVSPTSLTPSNVTDSESNQTPNDRPTKRVRRIPSYLLGEYGVYRDDESLEMTSETLQAHQLRRESALYSATSQPKRPLKKKKSLPQPIVNRELRELKASSGNDLWNVEDTCSGGGRISTRSRRKVSLQPANGIQWRLTKNRVYQFESINEDEIIPTQTKRAQKKRRNTK